MADSRMPRAATPSPSRRQPAAKSGSAGSDFLRAAAELDELGNSPEAEQARAELRRRAEAEGVTLVSFTIATEPLPDPALDALPQPERDRILEITSGLVEDPHGAASFRAELESLVNRRPHIPMLRNHLAMALQAAGEGQAAAEMFAEMVRLFPRYVFGFANHLQHLLATERIEEARELVEGGPRGKLFWLNRFDPQRTVFHLAEVVTFSGAIGHYLLSTDRIDEAERYLRICLDLYPDHPVTRELDRRMGFHVLSSALRKAIAQGPGRRGKGGGSQGSVKKRKKSRSVR